MNATGAPNKTTPAIKTGLNPAPAAFGGLRLALNSRSILSISGFVSSFAMSTAPVSVGVSSNPYLQTASAEKRCCYHVSFLDS